MNRKVCAELKMNEYLNDIKKNKKKLFQNIQKYMEDDLVPYNAEENLFEMLELLYTIENIVNDIDFSGIKNAKRKERI